MLTQLHIRNFAIIEELELELTDGMTALTGETGAGKSILIDALGLALGDRAESGVIRHEAERAEINIRFDLTDASQANQWLIEQELSDGTECLIRRVITREGRSRGFINGSPAPMQSLKQLGEMLVDIHGQHEHQTLLKRDIQRQLLDDFAGNNDLLQKISTTYHQWKAKTDELNNLQQVSSENNARLELLRYQIQELEELSLTDDEIPSLNKEHSRLTNASRLLETCQAALSGLYDDEEGTVYGIMGKIISNVDSASNLDSGLTNVKKLLGDGMIHIQEAVDELRHYLDHMEMDLPRLQQVEDRLAIIHDLSRKHKLEAEELPSQLNALKEELDKIENADEYQDALSKEIQNLRDAYDKKTKKLGKQRRSAAKSLNQMISESIDELGMPGAEFEVSIQELEKDRLTPFGTDSIEFMVSTNPGQPYKPVSKIASGGELSRISLAIQVTLSNNTVVNTNTSKHTIPTLIYDEVDSGIGGPTAEIVGQQLRKLGEKRQVLCVTHLPQVASQAHQHMHVSKKTEKNKTQTQIGLLNHKQRTEEIARMLGGLKITKQSLAHADEMIREGLN
jgi:DNA repair protein RecN (Recombination protein N)